ncbi:hypothetical protein L6452_19384 [Arctium lappa]|uniref:Uncharacterized protein n=1 Tax=Arctium lappa TaxID=4217 RepID=A0ACB9BCV1_ARCLA|nr:hypothetical protein L6452_19384 [Arctium lappa]
MADEVNEESFLDLFDSYWFFNKTENPPPQIHKNQQSIAETSQSLDFSAVPTINIRSYSDQLFITSNQQSFISDSPDSVLHPQTPELQTIFSGKEVKEIDEKETILPVADCRKSRLKENSRGKKSNSKSKSKSLSELEFEEVKGFMDLGFVFSEKDKETRLVSIIPGLQRLGEDEKEQVSGSVVSRPYLSEAWEKNIISEEAARPIRIAALGNELEIKHQLRFWAHSVASSVVR